MGLFQNPQTKIPLGGLRIMQKILLQKVIIKNSPAFKESSFEPTPNFNVFSGSSGAGKSVLMESILALFGLKESNAEILEATLELYGIPEELKGLIDEGEVTLTLTKKDKIRYFLNAQNIPKKKITEIFAPFLKYLGTKTYASFKEENLFFALDNFCITQNSQHKNLLTSYQKAFNAYQNAKSNLNKLQEESLKVNELKEFLQFEIQKLETLNPKKGEYEELLALKKEISKKEKISQSLQEVQEILNHSHKISNFLNLINYENDSILNAFSELESLCQQESERLNEIDNLNPEEILNRIEALSSLKHRYGGIDEAIEALKNKKEELQKYENLETFLKEAKNAFNQSQNSLQQNAKALLDSRNSHLQAFQQSLNTTLKKLKMPPATITLQELPLDSYNILGNANFIITLNTELKNLSAGEFNRFLLALLLTQSTQEKNQAIIILDEIDANLSGEESQGVAEILNQLSTNYQIFAISHQPHMPSLSSSHFLVQKHLEGSQIIPLDKNGRIQEIARMISGNKITKEALDFAAKCIENLQ